MYVKGFVKDGILRPVDPLDWEPLDLIEGKKYKIVIRPIPDGLPPEEEEAFCQQFLNEVDDLKQSNQQNL